MSELTQELRVKVSDDLHRLIHAFALANGEEAASLMRHVLQSYVDSEVRKHTLIARLLRSDGIGVDSQGSRGE